MSKSEVDSICKLARNCLQLEQSKQAKELYDKAIAKDVDCADAYIGLASIAYLDKDYPKAVEHFQKLTLLQPGDATHFTNLGALHNLMGEYSKAVEFLRKSMSRDKRCPIAYFNLGIAQKNLKQAQMAISAYREATRLDPKMVEAYQNLGNLYVETANLQLAIMNYKKALEIKPGFEKARSGLKKAEAAANSAKDQINPFGRLVDLKSHQTSAAVPKLSRELSDAERFEDRQEVRHISDEIERLAKGCLDFLKQKLEPAILDLQRTMAEGASAQVTLADVAEKYQAEVTKWEEMRKALKRKVTELRAHEELIVAPEVKL